MPNPMSMRWCRLYKGTAAELALEDAVAALGVPYRNNFPGFLYGVRYFADFYLPTLRLVIEVDDPSHDKLEKMESDAQRTADLAAAWGVRVVRCKNEEALNDPHGTVRRLVAEAGYVGVPAHLPKMSQALPTPRKAPQKIKREAKSAALRAQRKAKKKRN